MKYDELGMRKVELVWCVPEHREIHTTTPTHPVASKIIAILDSQQIYVDETILEIFIKNGIRDIEVLKKYKTLLVFGNTDLLIWIFEQLKNFPKIKFSLPLYHACNHYWITEAFSLIKKYRKNKVHVSVNDNFRWKDGNCWELEVFTQNILHWTNSNYIVVISEWKILWHIKCSGEKTFLSYVYSENESGEPMLIPWMVYSLKGAKELYEKWKNTWESTAGATNIDTLAIRAKRMIHTPIFVQDIQDFSKKIPLKYLVHL